MIAVLREEDIARIAGLLSVMNCGGYVEGCRNEVHHNELYTLSQRIMAIIKSREEVEDRCKEL